MYIFKKQKLLKQHVQAFFRIVILFVLWVLCTFIWTVYWFTFCGSSFDTHFNKKSFKSKNPSC